jgi:hypothetical protein
MSHNSAIIDRQILVIHRARPDAIASILPTRFRPRLFKDHAIAALSLVRLKPPKPRLMPSLITTQPEHLAHQIAIEWDANGQTRYGWFILRRDTTARSALLGGNIFPGKLNHARFHVHEQDARYRIHCDSDDQKSHVQVDAFAADFLPKTAIFASVEEAATFLQPATTFYTSATPSGDLEGLEIAPKNLPIQAMALWDAKSNLFQSDSSPLAEVDCAMLLRNVEYTWSESPAPATQTRAARPGA